MKPSNKKLFQHPVILVKILESGNILSVDSKTTVAIMDKITLNVVNGFNGKIFHEEYRSRVVDFNSDATSFVSVSSEADSSKLFNLKTKKLITKVTRHHGHVTCVGIDPLNRYMFSCSEDGKTFAMDINSGKLAFTLPVHVDAINDIVFSDNAKLIATASYDKKVLLFNIDSMSQVHRLIGHSAPVIKLQFLDNQRVFSVDKNGNGIVWDTKSGKVIKRLDGIHDSVEQVTKSSDNNFLFLATALGYILVYELQNYKLLSPKYIKLSTPITALCFDGERQSLIIATASKELFFYPIYYGEKDIEGFFEKKEYNFIYPYIENNPLLVYTKIYQKLEIIWDLTVKKAKLSLEIGDKNRAINLFKSFKNIPSKNRVMQKIILEYSDFDKFALFAKQDKIPLAYSLANKHPMYRDSKIFKSLEAEWKKTFVIAQKYSLDPKAQDKAREVLAPYRGVSEKTKFIKDLFMQGDVYRRFKIAIGQKDFKLSFELIKLNPFLKEFPEYEALMNYADTLYIKSQKFIENDDTHSAIKIFRILRDFSDFKEDAENMMAEIESKHKFYAAIKEEDIASAYNIMETFEELQKTEDGLALQKRWKSDFSKANYYAVDGDIKGIKNVLSDYMQINSKYRSLGRVFGWAYMIQLEQAVRQKRDQYLIENGIKNYILCFGLQEQIENFFNIFKKYYPKSKLNLELQTKGSLKMWRPSMIVNSILD